MPKKKPSAAAEPMEPLLFEVRGERVILDADLARIYGVPTFRFNEAMKRNRNRFPADFAFQLTGAERANLISQIAISRSQPIEVVSDEPNSSQIAMSSSKPHPAHRIQFASGSHGGRRKLPWVFTEHGALMAANILRSERAVEMSVYVVRAFVRQRAQLAADGDILKRLSAIDQKLLQHDGSIVGILNLIKALIGPPPPLAKPPKPRIGFKP